MKFCVMNTTLLCRAAHYSSPGALLNKFLRNGLRNAMYAGFFEFNDAVS